MRPDLFVWALGVGLVQGFIHCAGMCGPFVLAFSLSFHQETEDAKKSSKRRVLSLHLAHNGGRVLSFTLLGGLFGALGSFVNTVSSATGIDAVAALIGGLLMILWAVDQVRTGHGAGFMERWSLLSLPPIRHALRRILNKKTPGAAFTAGILLGFHPCGLIFAMLVSAAATGSAVHGALVLLMFGLGTIPALLGVAALGWFGSKRLRSKSFSYFAAILIGLSGVVFMLRGLAINGWIPNVNPWIY